MTAAPRLGGQTCRPVRRLPPTRHSRTLTDDVRYLLALRFSSAPHPRRLGRLGKALVLAVAGPQNRPPADEAGHGIPLAVERDAATVEDAGQPTCDVRLGDIRCGSTLPCKSHRTGAADA